METLKTYTVKVILEREVEADSEHEAVWAVIFDIGDMSGDQFIVNDQPHILTPEERDLQEVQHERLINSLKGE